MSASASPLVLELVLLLVSPSMIPPLYFGHSIDQSLRHAIPNSDQSKKGKFVSPLTSSATNIIAQMGCCLSTGTDEDFSNLRDEVLSRLSKENPRQIILRYVVAFDQAPPHLQEKALASLAFVIRLVDNVE